MNWIKVLHKFLYEPIFGSIEAVNRFDRAFITLSKCIYLILVITLRVFIGKKKRDYFIAAKKVSFMSILKRLHSKPMLVKARDGLFWCTDYATDFEVISDLHEPWFLAIFKPKISDIVLDLGAHIGRYSVVAGKLVGNSGKVIAIEADPYNFEILQLNIRANELQNVVSAINAAAWKEAATLTLFRNTFSGRHSVCNTTDSHSKINTITVDELVLQYNLPKIDWMKVDIEGAEYPMLLGAKDAINSKKIKFMVLEAHTYEILHVITQLLSPLYDISIVKRTQDDRYYVTARLLSEGI